MCFLGGDLSLAGGVVFPACVMEGVREIPSGMSPDPPAKQVQRRRSVAGSAGAND